MFRTSPQRAITATELAVAVRKYVINYFDVLAIGETLGFTKAEMKAAYGESVCGPSISSSYLVVVPSDWRSFWNELGLELDVSALRISEREDGFNRSLIMPKGATANLLYGACSKLFPCWRYTENLDIITSDRDPAKGAYVIWLRDRVEADEKLKGKSADHLAISDIKGRMTLIERLLFELKYFDETGEHLDVESATLCAGSRDTFLGEVPYVHWDAKNNRMNVDWHEPGTPINYGFSLRARAVIV